MDNAANIDDNVDWIDPETQQIHNFYASVIAVRKEGTIYTDSTGRFTAQSSRGMKYILVVYVHDCNEILVRPMKNRASKETFKM